MCDYVSFETPALRIQLASTHAHCVIIERRRVIRRQRGERREDRRQREDEHLRISGRSGAERSAGGVTGAAAGGERAHAELRANNREAAGEREV